MILFTCGKHFVTKGVKFSSHSRVGCSLRGVGPTRSSILNTPHQKMLRMTSLNVRTLRGKSRKVVETISWRGVGICFIQEVGWCGAYAHTIVDKDSYYKIFWIGTEESIFFLLKNWLKKLIWSYTFPSTH